jgi:hypothetical protein
MLNIKKIISSGGDWVCLLETRPLEDIITAIAEGWNNLQACMGKVKANLSTEVDYVL